MVVQKIYIGNMNFRTSEEDVKALFKESGFDIQTVEIIIDRANGRSKGFGFVTPTNPEQIDEIVEIMQGMSLAGRRLTINKAKPFEKEKDKRQRIRDRRNQ